MKNIHLICSLICFLLLSSCQQQPTDSPLIGIFKLKDSNHTGITFSNDLKETEKLNIVEYLYYYNGGGVAIGDINGDGLEDIYFTGNQQADRLYLNKGDLNFEDITEKSGIVNSEAWSSGVTMDDVNGDGHLDIYVCKVSLLSPESNYHNLLYINDGNGQFVEVSEEYGLNFSGYSTQSCFIDYDKDGDLDMYLLNHAVHSVRSYGNTEKRSLKDPVSGDLFFENKLNEEGIFVDVTEQAGIYNSPLGYGLAITAGDVNNDGWTDIYVGNDFHENDYLYLNNGDKTFTESIATSCTNTSQFSMGADMADMNNDGWTDIFTTDMMPYDAGIVLKSGGEDTDQIKRIKDDLGFEKQNARNHFQMNIKDGSFTDISFITRTFATDWSWSVLLQDFDNSLYNDIFITNGIVRRPNDLDYINYLNSNSDQQSYTKLIDQMPSQPLSNIVFTHTADLEYSSMEESSVGPPSFSTGVAYGDLDKDGDLDIVVNNINERAFVLENTASDNSNYLSVALKKTPDQSTVKGSKVILYTGENVITKELQTTKGYQSSSSHNLHFGLNDISTIDSIMVVWPDGSLQKLTDIVANQEMAISKGPVLELMDVGNSANLANQAHVSYVLPFKHNENKYYDENNEKLIPERLSYEGPALLCEDLNGDGIKDIFLGGARNQKATLLIGTKDGSFDNKQIPDFDTDAKYEDIDAATIDFDGDGDRDIYVISGGNDNKELDKQLEDRMYLNNGNGNFKRIPISLPHTNGSCISVADFDGDGYEDMFIGASTIPGSYGLSPYSFILKNLQGQGVDIAYKKRYGMVKDGEWADYDGDGDVDLIMCGDWMKIRVFQNNQGELTEVTNEIGFEKSYGFWNTLEITDINNDGNMDILAGNSGTNQKWEANDSIPIKLYVADFDENGSSDPIIFYPYFNRYIPFASLDKLTSQLPVLKKKFVSYDIYKDVQEITDLFADAEENIVEYKIVQELRSMVYIFEGNKFIGYPLGKSEQLSSINDFETEADGKIYYIGNNHDYTAELGASLSNSGGVLSNFENSNKRFSISERLSIPNGLNGRRICRISEDKLLVVSNNDYPFVIMSSEGIQ